MFWNIYVRAISGKDMMGILLTTAIGFDCCRLCLAEIQGVRYANDNQWGDPF